MSLPVTPSAGGGGSVVAGHRGSLGLGFGDVDGAGRLGHVHSGRSAGWVPVLPLGGCGCVVSRRASPVVPHRRRSGVRSRRCGRRGPVLPVASRGGSSPGRRGSPVLPLAGCRGSGVSGRASPILPFAGRGGSGIS